MTDQKAKKVIIVGGSLGGLFTGIVFTRLGYNVTILERTPVAALQDQGAGISLLGLQGLRLSNFLAEYDRTNTPTLESTGVVYVARDGSTKSEIEEQGGKPGKAASWDLLYNILRANFDGDYEAGYVSAAEKKPGDGEAMYVSGIKVTGLTDLGPEGVKVEYECVDGSKGHLEADIVIGADGPSSTVRRLLLPEVERKYAGYVAWRGTVKESLLSEESRTYFGTKSHFSLTKGSQAVHYKIPGLKGSLASGEQLSNLVWYFNAQEDELKRLLTDTNGVTHTWSLGVGKIKPEVRDEQRKTAAAILPVQIAEVFQKIESPFIQAITDSLATKSVFMDGKVLLIGEAVAGLRPNATAGCSQGAMQAMFLKRVFGTDGGMSIGEWEKTTLGWASFAYNIGVQMGNLSQSGDHPMADNRELPKAHNKA